TVQCASLPDALIEDELFGHRREAYAGAVDDRIGYLRAADRGTLFLDGIDEMPLAGQAALLRVISTRTLTPIGDKRPIPVDLAVVSATHRDVHAMANKGTFNAELFTRLRGVGLWVPPLRERREDIGLFIARTLARIAPDATLQPEAARRLLTAAWPGNVRELENVVTAAGLRASTRPPRLGRLQRLVVPPPPAGPAPP